MQRIGVNRESAARAVDESQRGFFEFRNDQAIALPGIFAQFLDALGHFHRAAELDCLVTCLVYLLRDRHHHARAHIVRPEALLAVAQGCIDKTNFSHGVCYSVKTNQSESGQAALLDSWRSSSRETPPTRRARRFSSRLRLNLQFTMRDYALGSFRLRISSASRRFLCFRRSLISSGDICSPSPSKFAYELC